MVVVVRKECGFVRTDDEQAGEWRKGWGVVLAGALGMALASVTVYSLGVFFEPLEREFGWSRAQIASGITISSMVSVFTAPLIGIAVDKLGPRPIAVLGVCAYSLAFAAFALVTSSLWVWWGLWLLSSCTAAAMKPTVWAAGVSSIFTSGRGLALSVMLCGTGVASSLTPIVGDYLIDGFGWRMAYLGLAAFWFVLVGPAVMVLFRSARDRQRSEPGGRSAPAAPLTGLSVREGLLSWIFVRLALAGFLAALTVVSFVSSLVPIMTSQGLPRQHAASLAGLVGIASIVGRLASGYLLDRMNGNLVGGVSLLMAMAATLLFLAWPGSPTAVGFGVLLLGLSLGAELDAVAYLATRHFGLRSFGVLFGTITGLLALATGLGPLLVNLSYDFRGDYGAVLVAYLPLTLLASLLFFSLGPYPVFSERATVD